MADFKPGDKVLVEYGNALNQFSLYPGEIIEGLGGEPPQAYRVQMEWLIAVVPADRVRHAG